MGRMQLLGTGSVYTNKQNLIRYGTQARDRARPGGGSGGRGPSSGNREGSLDEAPAAVSNGDDTGAGGCVESVRAAGGRLGRDQRSGQPEGGVLLVAVELYHRDGCGRVWRLRGVRRQGRGRLGGTRGGGLFHGRPDVPDGTQR